jgi:hypothetical protein
MWMNNRTVVVVVDITINVVVVVVVSKNRNKEMVDVAFSMNNSTQLVKFSILFLIS